MGRLRDIFKELGLIESKQIGSDNFKYFFVHTPIQEMGVFDVIDLDDHDKITTLLLTDLSPDKPIEYELDPQDLVAFIYDTFGHDITDYIEFTGGITPDVVVGKYIEDRTGAKWLKTEDEFKSVIQFDDESE